MSRCICLLFLLMCALSAAQAQGSRERSAASYVERGNGWLNKGELERAIDDYSLAIVFDGGHAGAYHNRGLGRLRKDDLDGALQDFDRSLELNPRLAMALLGRGLARCGKGEIAAGLADFNRAAVVA